MRKIIEERYGKKKLYWLCESVVYRIWKMLTYKEKENIIDIMGVVGEF